MSAGLDSSEAAIKALEQSAKVKMGWRDKAMILRDAPTAPPRGR
jgi:hypothetical protein